MQSYRNLDVWKVAHELTLRLYRDTATFPKQEAYVSPVRSGARRIPLARILLRAAGAGRMESYGSRCSTPWVRRRSWTTTFSSHDLGFLDPGTYAARLEDATRIQKMLSSFIVKLRPAAALLVTARSTNGQ